MNNQIKTFKYSDTENGHKSNTNINIWKKKIQIFKYI